AQTPHVGGRLARLRLQGFQLTGRETQRGRVLEAQEVGDRAFLRRAVLLEPQLQHAHRLEVFETLRLGKQPLDYSKLKSPLRGKHRSSSSPFLSDLMTSCVKLLACTYSPRKRSTICAKAWMPLPTKASSSTVNVTSMPRTRQ